MAPPFFSQPPWAPSAGPALAMGLEAHVFPVQAVDGLASGPFIPPSQPLENGPGTVSPCCHTCSPVLAPGAPRWTLLWFFVWGPLCSPPDSRAAVDRSPQGAAHLSTPARRAAACSQAPL